MKRYTLTDYIRDFSAQRQCLEFLRLLRWPSGIHCQHCEKITKHHLIEKRKCFSCQNCGRQVYPTADTIFEKSRTPLPIWFYVIYQMAQTRCGISAKQIERETGTTYKTAWRMCQLVRATLDGIPDLFEGIVEADESYYGGRPRHKGESKRGRGTSKQPVFGVVERGGGVVTKVVPNVQRKTILPIFEDAVEEGVTVHTDEFNIYDNLGSLGYDHERVNHGEGEYVRYEEDGEVVHTNTMEGFWALTKNGIRGVYHGVSPKYLQRYLNEYGFRYTHRDDEQPMFLTFLSRIAESGWHSAKL